MLILFPQPQRATLYIKDRYPNDKFEAAFASLFLAIWTPPHSDLSKQINLRVRTVSKSFSAEIIDTRLQNTLLETFTPSQADEIIAAAGTPEYKQKLADITKMVVEEQGAFGCPWFWVTNKEGKGEPFIGSDRYASSLSVNTLVIH
jgi:hypothetical protein